jgi:hypothetical protein
MVCPACHNNPCIGLARTTLRQPDAALRQPDAAHQARPFAVIVDRSKLALPAQATQTYPDWLKQFDAVTGRSLEALSDLVKNAEAPMVVRDTARALLSLRYRQPLPQINLAAVETEIQSWLTQHS